VERVVCDAIPFLRNSGQAIRLSALHTYYSALPLTPKTLNLFTCYAHKVAGIPNIVSSHPIWPAAAVRVLEGHTEEVNHVQFSPDGKKLASASDDNTLRLWDVESWQPIGDALKGHTLRVNHVQFSPDGKKLASASDDNTLRLWDVESGQPIGDALKGHTSSVFDVQISPDGKKLASASRDNTLRFGDIENGSAQLIAESANVRFNSAGYVAFPAWISRHMYWSFDSQGFLQHESTRSLWLPAPLRGGIAAHKSFVAIGAPSGAVTFIQWPVTL
jgi:WD40 repeat protein